MCGQATGELSLHVWRPKPVLQTAAHFSLQLLVPSGLILVALVGGCSRTEPVRNARVKHPAASVSSANAERSADSPVSQPSQGKAGHPGMAGNSVTTHESLAGDRTRQPSPQLAQTDSLPTDDESAAASPGGSAGGPAASADDKVPGNADSDTKSTQTPVAADWTSMPRQRWLLLAEGGPLLVDWIVEIDGRLWPDVLNDFYASAGKMIGLDTDGSVSWIELIESSVLRRPGMSESPLSADMARQVSRIYDRNRDSLVQEPELLEYLKSHPSFRGMFQPNPPPMRNRPTTAIGTTIWAALDTDQDGSLVATERQQVAAVLPRYDLDDDESVYYDELHSPPEILGRIAEQDRIRSPPTVVALDEVKEWGGLLYQLEERYSLGLPLAAGSWSEKELFVQLDQNGDGHIGEEEVQRLRDVPPHVVLLVSWGNAEQGHRAENAGTGSTPPLLTCFALPRGGHVEVEPVEGRPAEWVCRWPCGNALIVRLVDNFAPAEQLAENLWQSSDRDRNDYLNEEEFQLISAQTALVFATVDVDRDTKVSRHELHAALGNFCTVANVQIQANVLQNDDQLFFLLDADYDRRLTLREISGAASRLQALDRNGDGRLEPNELPTWWQVTLSHGAGDGARGTEQAPRVPPDLVRAADWFSAMDTNADGDISAREFLGPIELFETLDSDGDRLLSIDEAMKAAGVVPRATHP